MCVYSFHCLFFLIFYFFRGYCSLQVEAVSEFDLGKKGSQLEYESCVLGRKNGYLWSPLDYRGAGIRAA